MKEEFFMNLNDFDYSHAVDKINAATDEIHDRISSGTIAEQEYKAKLEGCIVETRDLLREMQEDSERESKINRRRFWINLIVSLIAATAAVISALLYILP